VLALNQYIQLDFRRNPSSSLSNKWRRDLYHENGRQHT
jgi:hypothetical protein